MDTVFNNSIDIQKNSTFLIDDAYNFYQYVWDFRDKRMDNYFLMSSPLPTLILCITYAILTIYVGPWFMKDREPFEVRPLQILYNFIMVIGNGFGHYLAWDIGWGRGYSFYCQPVDLSDNPHAVRTAHLVYIFYLSKYVDWVDTFFFVVRKKFTHVSFLHVYHHFVTPLNIWPAARFVPGGHITMCGLLNTFVHTVMYAYYFFASLGPEWKKSLWWKKYITLIQIIQFVLGMIHIPQALFRDCGVPKPFFLYIIPQGFLLLYLFTKFYINEYKIKKQNLKKH